MIKTGIRSETILRIRETILSMEGLSVLRRINFLTTTLSDASGGAIYDGAFFDILKSINPNVLLLDDAYFLSNNPGKSNSLSDFNDIYNDSLDDIFNCDVLFMNSRLYTRFLKSDLSKIRKLRPNTKMIVLHHHSNYMNHAGLFYLIHKHFEMRVLRNSDSLIIPNQYIVDTLSKIGLSEKIVFLPSSFERGNPQISNLDNKELLFVGNVERRKGILYALKALNPIVKQDKNVLFRVAGKYDSADKYYRKLISYVEAHQLKDNVIFEGRVDDERLERLYSGCSLFVFPSLLEGYGWVMAEAMSHGLPVIAFDNSAMPYLVKSDYNGCLVRNKDWKGMSRAIQSLLMNKNKMIKLQKGALKTFDATPIKSYLEDKTRDYLENLLR